MITIDDDKGLRTKFLLLHKDNLTTKDNMGGPRKRTEPSKHDSLRKMLNFRIFSNERGLPLILKSWKDIARSSAIDFLMPGGMSKLIWVDSISFWM